MGGILLDVIGCGGGGGGARAAAGLSAACPRVSASRAAAPGPAVRAEAPSLDAARA